MVNPEEQSAQGASRKICVGVITGAQGLQGAVRLKSFTARPEDAVAYGSLYNESGDREFQVKLNRVTNKGLVVSLKGVTSRTEAEALKGTELYIERDALPLTEEDEFYYTDLIGLRVETVDGTEIGSVKAMDNFGAGEILEVALSEGGSIMLPFTKAIVPEVDIAAGRLVVDPPEEVEPDPNEGQDKDEDLS